MPLPKDSPTSYSLKQQRSRRLDGLTATTTANGVAVTLGESSNKENDY